MKSQASIGELLEREIHALPEGPGVYVVVAPPDYVPRFLERGTGGHFKGRDPNVDVARLKAGWAWDTRERARHPRLPFANLKG